MHDPWIYQETTSTILQCWSLTQKHPCGLPLNSHVQPVNDLVVIDTVHGFRYSLLDQWVDDILLLPHSCILENQPKQDAVQAACDALYLSTKKSLLRGMKRIVSFQSPGLMYLTPGAFPRRNGHGFQVRGLKDISHSYWGCIYKCITNCKKSCWRWTRCFKNGQNYVRARS